MKNISKTDKKILNEFEINYLVLLLNASIYKLNRKYCIYKKSSIKCSKK